jgi:hypothetical protein
MITYEITALVRADLRAAYQAYMTARHIPDLLATGCFAHASLAQSTPGRYRVRCDAHDRAALDRYLAQHAPGLRRHFVDTFPDGIDVSREEWVVLTAW